MTINISQLTGAKLKKSLGLTKASKRYHNKSSGTFGFVLQKNNKQYEINGRHDEKGNIIDAKISTRYHPGLSLVQPHVHYTEYHEFISNISTYMSGTRY